MNIPPSKIFSAYTAARQYDDNVPHIRQTKCLSREEGAGMVMGAYPAKGTDLAEDYGVHINYGENYLPNETGTCGFVDEKIGVR